MRIEDGEGWNLELRCMRCTQTDTHRHTDTQTQGQEQAGSTLGAGQESREEARVGQEH